MELLMFVVVLLLFAGGRYYGYRQWRYPVVSPLG
jgi:hypothetical protein